MTEDIHADDSAENQDTRVVVETSGLGVDIIREKYGLVKYDNSGPTRWYDWFEDESFHLRVDEFKDVLEQAGEIDLEQIQGSLDDLLELDEALGGSSQ